jgi:hypothetical protein
MGATSEWNFCIHFDDRMITKKLVASRDNLQLKLDPSHGWGFVR